MEEKNEYAICKCPECGAKLCVAEYSSTVNMRIDGKLHPIGVRRVPCNKCESCDWATMDASADEYYMYYYNKYCNENGLNTTYLKIKRRIRRFFLCYYDRIARDYYRFMRKFSNET